MLESSCAAPPSASSETLCTFYSAPVYMPFGHCGRRFRCKFVSEYRPRKCSEEVADREYFRRGLLLCNCIEYILGYREIRDRAIKTNRIPMLLTKGGVGRGRIFLNFFPNKDESGFLAILSESSLSSESESSDSVSEITSYKGNFLK